MSQSLSATISEGFRDVAGRAEPGPDPARLRARIRDLSLSPAERDEVFAVAVGAYRAGSRRLWGPVILELLAPAILERVVQLRPPEPHDDYEDLGQQLLLEVLKAAATVPLRADPAYLRLRVLRRADKGMGRWLAKQVRHQDWRVEFHPEMAKQWP